jgi:16S rRNA (guanine527-N7)-methyltransferase
VHLVPFMAPEIPSDHSGELPAGRETAAERVSAGQRPVPEPLRRLATSIAASPHNLVSAAERPAVLERHVLEAGALADALTPSGRWMDLGTGGGLPGLVLAWRHTAVAWTLVDATAKKVEAVRGFAAELQLANVTVVHARAETLAWDATHRGSYGGVVARAVAPLVTLVELARGFLQPDGDLVAIKGPGWREELQRAQRALETLGFLHVHSQRLAWKARETWLVTMRAAGDPPAGYPRRDGLPKSDPLR